MGSEHPTVAVPRAASDPPAVGSDGSVALARFCVEVLALAGLPEGLASGSPHSRGAAGALVDLALAQDERRLAALLRPDPVETDVTWTVACYRIGDFLPAEVRDFPTAVSAVVNATSCTVTDHVAAELVASTREGVRWTALYRTGERLVFQLPSAANGSDSTGSDGRGLADALAHWQERLSTWRTGPDADPTLPADWAVPAAGRPAGTAGDGSDGADAEVLSKVLHHLVDLEARLAATTRLATDLAARLERVERVRDVGRGDGGGTDGTASAS